MFRIYLLLLPSILILLPQITFAQTTYYPAKGFYNGFLNQINIVECDNNNDTSLDLGITVTNSFGEQLSSESYSIAASGSRHIILNDVASITDTYGTYTLNLSTTQTALGDKLNCRTSFYRPSADGTKTFEYAYVVPVQNAQVGVLGGIYNSMDPGNSGVVTENWLSIINFSTQAMSGNVNIYAGDGTVSETVAINALAPGGRQDIPLGHPNGNITGLYQIIPDDPSLTYEAFVVRYNPNDETNGFRFAFPLRALRGACSGEPLLASTMGNGLTDNWLEIANISPLTINATITVKDRAGATLHSETRGIPAFGQSNLYLSSIIDPSNVGNVGTATVTCEDKNDELVIQSTFYGKTSTNSGIEWAYSTQARDASLVTTNSFMSVPVNTYASMSNWLKLADSSQSETLANFTVHNQAGEVVANGDSTLSAGGTVDIGIHEMSGADSVGSVSVNSATETSSFSGEMLRVLPRNDGGVGNIVSIPGIVQQSGENAVTSFGDTGKSFVGDPQSLAPYKDKLTHAEASHFLEKAAIGGTFDELNQLKNVGLSAMIDELLTVKEQNQVFQDAIRHLDGQPENEFQGEESITWPGVQMYWLHQLANTKNPLQEKMALTLHDLFATSCSVVAGDFFKERYCRNHADLVRSESLGNFRRLLLNMTTDFTMLIWLNNNLNVKQAPDENYAREHWELFSTGEPSKEGGKFPIYTDKDVAEAARAFTGWTNVRAENGTESVQFISDNHDNAEKVLWEGTPYETRGNFTAADITNLTLNNRPEAARFVARRVFVSLVHDSPSPGLINQLATILKNNDWELKPLIRVILNSEAMFSRDAHESRLKDPISYLVGFLRRSGMRYDTQRLRVALTNMGFTVTGPPDVNGWPGNKFQEADTTTYWFAWSAQYSSATMEVMRWLRVDFKDDNGVSVYDWTDFLPSPTARSTEVVDYWLTRLGIEATPEQRSQYIEYMDTIYNPFIGPDIVVQDQPFDPADSRSREYKMPGVLWLITQHESYRTF